VFAALVIQHAKRMCPVTLASMACPALPHISAGLSEKNFPESKMGYFDFLYNISQKHF
jgi:hypothetical protein